MWDVDTMLSRMPARLLMEWRVWSGMEAERIADEMSMSGIKPINVQSVEEFTKKGA